MFLSVYFDFFSIRDEIWYAWKINIQPSRPAQGKAQSHIKFEKQGLNFFW